MNRLTLTKDQSMDVTVVSNYFIDDYMTQANEAQIKIYLYLLRLLSAGISTSISELADKYNMLEQDVVRCIKYWQQKGLLEVSFDASGDVNSICFVRPAAEEDKKQAQLILLNPATTPAPKAERKPAAKAEPASTVAEKPSYSLDELKQLKSNDSNFSERLFVAESYLGKTLSHSEVESIAYIIQDLKFSAELFDHLMEYCVDRGKKSMRYIETVAIRWANEHVVTVRQAKLRSTKYDKVVYTIMNALGRTESPTDSEAEFINRWYKDYAFSVEVILEACKKAVLATQSNRFSYTEGILSKWKAAGIHTLADVTAEEERFNKEKAQKTPQKKTPNNSFNNIPKRDYDFAELEKKLKSN